MYVLLLPCYIYVHMTCVDMLIYIQYTYVQTYEQVCKTEILLKPVTLSSLNK